ncbi:hypothetical protein LCGC14_2369510 [marine sediment metagenome]|uniref:Major capsid protein n=1 Tax=marine sediment metagenome TaxID=412755 RepID=A0A0F9C4B0_9ZZZZ
MAMGNLAGTGEALDSSLDTIHSAFNLLRDETGVFRSTATTMELKPHEGRSKLVNNYNRVVALDIADGVDAQQAQQLADTTTTYTPGEVIVQVLLPGSTMRRVADPELLRRTGRMLNNAYDLKEDQDGGLQMVNWTPIMGVATNILGPFEYLGAVQRLSIGNNRANPEPPPTPHFIVDHPLKLGVLAARLVPFSDLPNGAQDFNPGTVATGTTVGSGAATGGLSDDIIKRGIGALGTFWGTTVKQSANLIPDSGDDVSGGAYSKEGLIFVSEVTPRTDADTSDKSLRGAVELNTWGSYVWGLYRAGAYGVEILGNTSFPAAS